jgi:hypothetical protein
MANLRIGQNLLSERDLFYVDGVTPLLIADLTLVRVELIQYNRVIADYYLKDDDDVDFVTDPEITATGVSQITVEIKSSVSATLREGLLQGKIYLEKVDADFNVDLEFKPIDVYDIVTMIR